MRMEYAGTRVEAEEFSSAVPAKETWPLCRWEEKRAKRPSFRRILMIIQMLLLMAAAVLLLTYFKRRNKRLLTTRLKNSL